MFYRSAFPLLCLISASHAATLKVPVPFVLDSGVSESPEMIQDPRPFLVVKLKGAADAVRLPASSDTTLLNKQDVVKGRDPDIQLRDNRWHQGLFRFDVAALPKDAEIEDAKFEFTIGWAEKDGGAARFDFHRMLSDWSDDATWAKPSVSSAEWKGMAPAKDFEAAAFASHSIGAAKSGAKVSAGGFGPLVADWASGRVKNHGFSAVLYGKATQVNIRSTEARLKKPPVHQLRVDPGKGASFRVGIDPTVIRRLVLSPEEVKGGELRFSLMGKEDPSTFGIGISGRSFRVEGRYLYLSVLGEEMRNSLAGNTAELAFSFDLQGDRLFTVGGPDGAQDDRPKFMVETEDHPNEQIWGNRLTPRPGVYVEHRDGNLFYGGERLRLWGAVGFGDIPRIKRMGFNAWRIWPVAGTSYDEASARSGDFLPTVRGDGSELDGIDKTFASFKENGIFVMATQLMGVMPPKWLMRDDSFVAGGADWEEWKSAVKALPGSEDATGSSVFRSLAFIDDRVRKARIRHAVNFLNRLNPYTGKRYAEEEHIAIWELDNEMGFVRQLFDGASAKWPKYFQEQLDAKWSKWVKARYPDETALVKAWGKLEAGEASGFLKAGPFTAQAASAPPARTADFAKFVLELTDGFYQELRTQCRAQAKPGIGVASAAFSFDTQYRPHIPWIYQQSLGDVANFGMYFWDHQSQLTRPPSMYVMDSHTVENKVTVIYETNQSRPGSYRTEFPFRLAALACWQDWDAVFFHYWLAPERQSDEEFLTGRMKYMTTSHYWDAVHHDVDPAMTSTMAVAGRLFIDGLIAPAPVPAVYRIGKKGLFGYKLANGLGMRDETFSRGAVLRFEPEGDFDVVKENSGPASPDGAVKSGEAITWDWQNGRLIVDTPQAKVYVGPAPAEGWKFKDGITLSGVSSSWLSFAMVSAVNRPVLEGGKVYMTSMFDAVNTGFEMDDSVQGGPTEQAQAIRNPGRAPVKVDKVDYTVSFPKAMEWESQSYDFALRVIGTASGKSGAVRVRALDGEGIGNSRPQEIWMNVVNLKPGGETIAAVVDPSPGASATDAGLAGEEKSDASLGALWHPLPGISWGDNAAAAKRKAVDMKDGHSSLIASEDSVRVADSRALFDAPAEVGMQFEKAAMKRIVVTFTEPPSFRAAVEDYEKRFGKPVEKALTDEQFSQSTVKWLLSGKVADLSILMTEAQGTMKIVFDLNRKN